MKNDKAETQEEFEFIDSKDWFTRGLEWLSRKLVSSFGLSTFAPPMVYKKTGIKNWFNPEIPDLNVLGKITGFSDSNSQESLTFHKHRFKIYKIILSAIYFILGISLVLQRDFRVLRDFKPRS